MTDYELIDCGDFRRLERFGVLRVDRPARQAGWAKALPAAEWQSACAVFGGPSVRQSSWRTTIPVPENWMVRFEHVTLSLRLSPGGQVGVFPEQQDNWQWVSDCLQSSPQPLRILNAFAYTGATTLFAARAALHDRLVEVCHVDASRSAVAWAKRNADISGLRARPLRWIVDDALAFMQREVRRGVRYDGLILDPPAFGRTPKGTPWVLRRDLPHLLQLSSELMSTSPAFILLSCHDPEMTKTALAEGLAGSVGIDPRHIQCRDLVITSQHGNDLPAGIAVRWRRT